MLLMYYVYLFLFIHSNRILHIFISISICYLLSNKHLHSTTIRSQAIVVLEVNTHLIKTKLYINPKCNSLQITHVTHQHDIR